jgi:protease PrsW
VRQSFLITIGVFVGVAILINLLLDNPTFDKLSDKADFELQANQTELAEKTLLQIVLQDSLNIENHYRYISTHFDIPERKKVGKNRYEYRDDNTIQNFYNSLAQSADSNLADIGFYGKGLIQVNLEKYPSAISEFQQVKNKNLNYLNNSIGNAYNQIGEANLAEQHFRKEIESNGNLDGAYSNLIQLLFDQDRTEELNDYLKNPETKKYFPSRVERAIYFKSFQPIKYGTILLKRVFSGFNIWGAIAALLIMCSWIMYLRKLDIFEVEKWKHIIITVLLGMLFSFLTYPLSDFDNLIFGFKLNGGLINDFFYSVIGIGAIEEFVKIVPLLLMMRFTKAVNEPFDYIKYASLSALGFAFVENLIYFNESNLHIIHGRALTAVVSHMFDSSIIAYGIILNKYKRNKNPYLNFIFFFALASISHGFYDFWLINKSASTFSILTILFLLASMYMWNSFKNNALNHSDFYDKDKSIDSEKLQDYLLYSLAGVLLFEYIALAFKYCPSVANSGLFSSLYSGTYLIIFLSGNLSKFSITKGQWAPIKYWGTEEKINYENVVDTELKLNSFTQNDHAIKYLPNSGKIFKRLTVSEEPDWYLIKLDTPKQLYSYLADTVLIRTKEKDEQIEKGKKKFIAFYLIPTDTNLDKDDLKRTDFKFCGWATTK